MILSWGEEAIQYHSMEIVVTLFYYVFNNFIHWNFQTKFELIELKF